MLALPVVLGVVVVRYVDLQPHVDENFFFQSDDPELKQAIEVERSFPGASQLYLAVAAPDIASEKYFRRIGELTAQLKAVAGVTGVHSITAGPKNFKDALASPLWRRLLIAGDRKSTNLILDVAPSDVKQFIRNIERTVAELGAKDFRIHIAGMSFVTELIRRNLVHDLQYFSLTALVVFGVMVGGIFRSWRTLLGTLTTCLSAMMLTLIAQEAIGMQMGILTTNLSTIVFVVTLSHIVFMTGNWRSLAVENHLTGRELARAAWRRTLHPSFWCMATTVLGFGSLFFVPARPLRDLGVGGVIGTAVAMVCAYAIYPAFLRWATPVVAKGSAKPERGAFWARRYALPVLVVAVGCAALAVGLPELNTDPSLLDYFAERDPIRQGLNFVDRTGGSNPLKLVVRSADGSKLTNAETYKRLWKFQTALEEQPDVGVVLSLPVLMAEARRAPLSVFLRRESIIRQLEQPAYGRVAERVVTKDRREAMFLLRMIESERKEHHLKVVERLHRVADNHGFEPTLTGGVFYLQGHLARQVNNSLVRGLGALIGLFTIIALIVALSPRVGLAMIVSLCLVPVSMLGVMGLIAVPLDIISAPAANVCIGMAVDSMIHVVMAVRRRRTAAGDEWQAWTLARREQWRGVLGSCTIVATGFAIFAISNFPPTQRFGLAVVFGTAIAAFAALFVLPVLGGFKLKRSAL